MNPVLSFGLFWKKGVADKEELLSKLLEEYDVEESLAQQDIDAFLQKLIENNLID